MKKKQLKSLSISKKTISRLDETYQIQGGRGTMSTEPGCGGGTVSAVIICMEEFTEGCSPSFLNECPYTKHTDPQYCW